MDAPLQNHVQFSFAEMSARERYKLLIGSVVPRPIAFVTTASSQGTFNAAPFSFFNVLTHDPAIVAIGVENHADLRFKDTAHNIRETEEFTVNIADAALADAMEICAVKFPPEIDEFAEARITAQPGTHVCSPRILEAPIALECRRHVTLELGKAREVILGQVIAAFIRRDLINLESLHIDQIKLDAIGRMGGHLYCYTREQLEIRTPAPDEWRRMKEDGILPSGRPFGRSIG